MKRNGGANLAVLLFFLVLLLGIWWFFVRKSLTIPVKPEEVQ